MNRRQLTLKNATISIICKILNMVILFIIRTIFIYTLGREYLGVSSLFTSILTMLSLTELGFGAAITYNLYKPIVEKNTEKLAKLMNFYKNTYVIIGIIVFILGLVLIPFLGNILKETPNIKENIVIIYVMYLLNASISYFLIYKSTLLVATEKNYLVSIISTIVHLIKGIAEAIILIITKNFIVYLSIEILATILYNVLITLKAQRDFPELNKYSKSNLEKEEKKKIFKNVKAMMLYKASGVILNGTDNVIINKYINTIYVGIYSNYNMIIAQLYSFIIQIFTAITASVGNIAVKIDKNNQLKVFNNILFLSFCIYCWCSTVLLVTFNRFIVFWIGYKYLLGIDTVIILVFDFYIMGMLSPVTAFRTANGLFMQGQYRPLIMAVINIVTSIILVKIIGINGVFIGTVLSRILTQLWYDPWLIYKKVFIKSSKEYFIKYIKYMSTTLISTTVAYYLAYILNVKSNVMGIILSIAIGTIISIIFIYIVFNKTSEFSYLKMLIKESYNKLFRKEQNYEN